MCVRAYMCIYVCHVYTHICMDVFHIISDNFFFPVCFVTWVDTPCKDENETCSEALPFSYTVLLLSSRFSENTRIYVLYMHKCLCVFACTYLYIYSYKYIYIHVYINMYVYVYIHMYIHIFIYIHMYICTHVYIYIYICIYYIDIYM